MPSSTIQSRISAFEALSRPPPSSSSLVDLQEWVVDDGHVDARESSASRAVDDGHIDARPAPPLPPRKPSHTSLKSAASSSASRAVDHTYPLLDARSSSASHAVDHTYPPLDARPRPRHAPAASISSFHSVSLSSDTTDASLSPCLIDDESYEEVSTPPLQQQVPPKLPRRPASASAPASPTARSTASSAPSAPSQPPPLPRSSVAHPRPTHLNVRRPTPVPPAARARYDAVFDANIAQRRRAEQQPPRERPRPPLLSPDQARAAQRRAVGWRGLSVDLIGHDAPDDDVDRASEPVAPTETLDGRFVKPIWRRSRLGRKTLGEIWNECDPDRTGSLTRDQFARGMWRIDEELTRAQVHALKSTSTRSLRAQARPPVPKIRPILR